MCVLRPDPLRPAFLAAFMGTFLATFLADFLDVVLAALLVTVEPREIFPEGWLKLWGKTKSLTAQERSWLLQVFM